MCTNSEENVKKNKLLILAIVKLVCLEFLKPSHVHSSQVVFVVMGPSVG